MPSYKRFIILLSSLFVLCGCSESQSNLIKNSTPVNTKKQDSFYKTYSLENRDIMFALEFDRNGFKENARELYEILYTKTNKEEYLVEFSRLSFGLKKFDELTLKVEENKSKIKNFYDEILRIYILTKLQQKNYDKALVEAKKLTEKNNSTLNQELLGNIYMTIKDFPKAKEVFEDLYDETKTASAALSLSNVMYLYLDEKDAAIRLLDSYIRLNGCNNIVCSKLLSIYQEQKNEEGIVSLLKKTYYSFKDRNNQFSQEKVYKLLMYYLERKDINEAILFLEKSGADDDKLLTLYRNNMQYVKAHTLAQKLYETTSNIDYLAQVAILEFESAKNKKKVLKSVINKFEEVLTVLDNHIYQNYLGYLLIDYNIDINKGLAYVNKALEKAPNNLAYIDSLAWGQYKLKQCDKAYKNMKKVVDSAGLKDKEIRDHWYKIKECNK